MYTYIHAYTHIHIYSQYTHAHTNTHISTHTRTHTLLSLFNCFKADHLGLDKMSEDSSLEKSDSPSSAARVKP